MNFLLKMLKPLIKTRLIKELEKKETKDLVINYVNSKINIPQLNEVEEAKLFEEIYNSLLGSVVLIVDRI